MFDWFVPAISTRKIDAIAGTLRYVFNCANQYVPNLCGILEHYLPNLVEGYDIEFVDVIQLDNGEFAEAQTEFSPPKITFSSDVYLKLVQDDPRSRFTAAHEIGHLMLHQGLATLKRMPEKSVAKYQANSAEWQANRFAAAFLAPESLMRSFDSPDEVAEMMKISMRMAQIRMTELKLWPKVRDISTWKKAREEFGLPK